MKKYCLVRKKHFGMNWYFTGKQKKRNSDKYDYTEGDSLTRLMNSGQYIFDSYRDAIAMKLECLFVKGILYNIIVFPEN